MSEAEIAQINPSYIIFDEFHRCGAAEWGKGVERLLSAYPNVPLLGLSAAAIRYLDNQRNMADELFDGNIASEMTLGEVIVRGILTPPTYVVSMYSYQKELERYEHKIKKKKYKSVRDKAEKYLEALRRTLEKDIVNERFEITDVLRDCNEIFHGLEDTLSVSWELMYSYAKAYFEEHGHLEVPRRFKTPDGYSLGNWLSTQRKVYNGTQYGELNSERIEKLNEIGMRWKNAGDVSWERFYGEAKAYYDKNGDLDTNISYVSENGYPLGRRICQMRSCRKSNITVSLLTAERIAMLDEIGMIWSVPDYLWEKNYMAALEYYRAHESLDVPKDYIASNGVNLGAWLRKLRGLKLANSPLFNLTQAQVNQLDEIGMLWANKYERQWNKGYKEAEKYFNKYGNLDVPNSYVTANQYKLGAWISNQRENSEKMKPERREKLNAIGMVWKKTDPWELRFRLAKEYYETHGDLNVPPKYTADGVWLNKWLNEQKQIYFGKREGKSLSAEQIKRLEAIGMDWKSAAERAWEIRFEAVRRFYEEYGHLDIPKDYVLSDGRKIGDWIVKQRRYCRDGKLTNEQIAKLDRIGMSWGRKAS